MKVLLCCWGSTGDISPQIYVGGELSRRGHDVHVVANPYFKNLVASSGAEFTAVGSREDHERLLADSDVFDRERKTSEEVYADHYYPFLGQRYKALESLYEPGHTLMLLGGSVTAWCFAERWDVPRVALCVSPVYVRSRFDPPHPERPLPWWARWAARTPRRLAALHRLNDFRRGRWRVSPGDSNTRQSLPADHPVTRLREEIGLSATVVYEPCRALCLWPDWFAAPQPDWPSRATTTGFVLPPAAASIGGPGRGASELERSCRPIVFTTGSLAGSQARFFAAAVEVCRQLGVPGCIVTPHRDQVPVDLPSKVEYFAHAPFEELFPRAAMVVHHGGIGTGALALAAGIPQILCPLRGDQFDNANRFERLGVGTVVDARRITPDRLAAAARAIFKSATVTRQCAHWRSRMAAENGVQRAADYVEREFA